MNETLTKTKNKVVDLVNGTGLEPETKRTICQAVENFDLMWMLHLDEKLKLLEDKMRRAASTR